jgi:hypothetical protein
MYPGVLDLELFRVALVSATKQHGQWWKQEKKKSNTISLKDPEREGKGGGSGTVTTIMELLLGQA